MEEIVASVADLKFEIEAQMYNQVGVQPLPFPGMDSTIQTQLDCSSLCFGFYLFRIEKTACLIRPLSSMLCHCLFLFGLFLDQNF